MKKFKKQELRPDVVIKWAGRGAYVVFNPDDCPEHAVYTFDDDDLNGLGGFCDLLADIRDRLYPGGKYDWQRIKISLEHGNCYVCKNQECKICHPS